MKLNNIISFQKFIKMNEELSPETITSAYSKSKENPDKNKQTDNFFNKLTEKYKQKMTSVGPISKISRVINVGSKKLNGLGITILNKNKIKVGGGVSDSFSVFYNKETDKISTSYKKEIKNGNHGITDDESVNGNMENSLWEGNDKMIFDNIIKIYKSNKI